MLSSFYHIWACVGPRRVASAYSMLKRMIFSTCSMGILLLVLIFSWMNFRYSTVRAPCSVIFACWVPIEGQFVVMVAQRAPVANWALHRVLSLCGLGGAVF